MPEEWGGTTVTVPLSAKKRLNIDSLLEMILLVTEMGELKANPKRDASGTVLEAKLDRGRGSVATVLVQDGTLKVGDTFIAGPIVSKVRALIDDRGRNVRVAGPSTPVEVLGLDGLPSPGDTFQVINDPAKARQIAMYRQQKEKERTVVRAPRTLEELQKGLKEGSLKELALIIKADVGGSAEVLADTLQKLSDEQVKLRIIMSGVGAINESDVQLAMASNAIIIGFNVRPSRDAAELAEREHVDIRIHSVIYNVTDEMRKAMSGLLEPTFKEVRLGHAEIRQLFKVPKIGTVAGCMVTDGLLKRSGGAGARLLREGKVVHEGPLASLKRFKDDVSEVKSGLRVRLVLRALQRPQAGRRGRGVRHRARRGAVSVGCAAMRALCPAAAVPRPGRGPELPERMHSRPERVGEEILQELTVILAREVKDPAVGFVTLTYVKMSADLQVARVYYTVMGDEKARLATGKALERAIPFMRRHIAARVRLRRVPELRFTYDESVDTRTAGRATPAGDPQCPASRR